MTKSETNNTTTPEATGHRSVLFNVLLGVTTLVVLLQGLWAGIFLQHDGRRDAASGWINVHAVGAYLAGELAVAAAIVALRLRPRKDLVRGSTALALLLLIETGLGQAAHSGTDTLTAVHVPLAMAIMAVAVGLAIRARNHQ